MRASGQWDPVRKTYRYKPAYVPSHRIIGLGGHREGIYKQNDNSIQIEIASYKVKATIKGNQMSGIVTLVLESNQKVRWVARRISGRSNSSSASAAGRTPHANVIRGSDGKLRPADGYRWVNGDDPKDFRVEIIPGLIKTEDGFRPAKGYRWVNPKDPKDFRVEPIP